MQKINKKDLTAMLRTQYLEYVHERERLYKMGDFEKNKWQLIEEANTVMRFISQIENTI